MEYHWGDRACRSHLGSCCESQAFHLIPAKMTLAVWPIVQVPPIIHSCEECGPRPASCSISSIGRKVEAQRTGNMKVAVWGRGGIVSLCHWLWLRVYLPSMHFRCCLRERLLRSRLEAGLCYLGNSRILVSTWVSGGSRLYPTCSWNFKMRSSQAGS